MGLLKKIENNDKALDISLYGTGFILIFFLAFCSVFDYWILTLGKEAVIHKTEICEFNALAASVDYTSAAFKQDFIGYFEAANIEDTVEDNFRSNFSNAFKNAKGFVYNVKLVNSEEVRCYPSHETYKICLESGDISFKVKKLLKVGKTVPFIGNVEKDYRNETVYSNVSTNVLFIFE